MDNNFEKAKEKYPSIPDLDMHFYGMKGYGINDKDIEKGRPVFHIIDSEKLFSLTPFMSSENSPYIFNENVLTYNGQKLPFRVKNISRIKSNAVYFYQRGIQEWMPTLYSETILSLNFQPFCKGCDWCCKETKDGMRNLSPEEGVKILKEDGVDPSKVHKVTFVTGMYRNGEEVVDNILLTMKLLKDEGFDGRVLYIGSQIKDGALASKINNGLEDNDIHFKYAYTLESFTQRGRMHAKKNTPLQENLSILEEIKNAGVENIEYSYMPGLDSLNEFYEWMPRFSRLAKPHISIFRPLFKQQENLRNEQFAEDPYSYLCSMRLAFEEIHGPVYQNNLGSLWGFPISKINPLFLTEKTHL